MIGSWSYGRRKLGSVFVVVEVMRYLSLSLPLHLYLIFFCLEDGFLVPQLFRSYLLSYWNRFSFFYSEISLSISILIQGDITDLAVSNRNKYVASASNDFTIRVVSSYSALNVWGYLNLLSGQRWQLVLADGFSVCFNTIAMRYHTWFT